MYIFLPIVELLIGEKHGSIDIGDEIVTDFS